jgi:protein subunit release factor A
MSEPSQVELDTDVRVIDQRIGMGVGGLDTVIRIYHRPTGIIIEMPRLHQSQYYDRRAAFEMLEYALAGLDNPHE